MFEEPKAENTMTNKLYYISGALLAGVLGVAAYRTGYQGCKYDVALESLYQCEADGFYMCHIERDGNDYNVYAQAGDDMEHIILED